MIDEQAECGDLAYWMERLGTELDEFQKFDYPDALQNSANWQAALDSDLPKTGVGIDTVVDQLSRWVIPNGSAITRPGFSSFITTGPVSVAVLATLAGAIAAPQRIGLTAFQYLETLSLAWLRKLFDLPESMQGIYSSGGSVANLVALGAARQWAFERTGTDPAAKGMNRPACILASAACHRTVHRAAAVLGIGRDNVIPVDVDRQGRMRPEVLQQRLRQLQDTCLPVAVVANAGTTGTGAIDPLAPLGEIARQAGVWFHVDGAYGLPGILDPDVKPLYAGLELADSVVVDPHKWLGAPVGIGTTFVRDRGLLQRAFTQGASDYLEGTVSRESARHSLDDLGVPFSDMGIELSAPCRGAVVWALIQEIGKEGLAARVRRHNAMARHLARRVESHPNLELLLEPTLSICCFRYVSGQYGDLDELNRKIHRQLIHNGTNMPSTAQVNGALAIRPCFIGARTSFGYADDLLDEVLLVGQQLCDNLRQSINQ